MLRKSAPPPSSRSAMRRRTLAKLCICLLFKHHCLALGHSCVAAPFASPPCVVIARHHRHVVRRRRIPYFRSVASPPPSQIRRSAALLVAGIRSACGSSRIALPSLAFCVHRRRCRTCDNGARSLAPLLGPRACRLALLRRRAARSSRAAVGLRAVADRTSRARSARRLSPPIFTPLVGPAPLRCALARLDSSAAAGRPRSAPP
ncbi:hypothetical protein Scep_019401 [Stephania cephalantha]|uniref:Uncharacterized protein n=1 Tax=Stephania cephalantha TaxID=152367 RepID=A0AAP0IAZ5_9MAGN